MRLRSVNIIYAIFLWQSRPEGGRTAAFGRHPAQQGGASKDLGRFADQVLALIQKRDR